MLSRAPSRAPPPVRTIPRSEMSADSSGAVCSRALEISELEIADCLAEPINTIIEGVKQTLEQTAPELSADISDRGIVLTGGGALLGALDSILHLSTGLPVTLAEDPLTCGARGAGRVLEENELLGTFLQD